MNNSPEPGVQALLDLPDLFSSTWFGTVDGTDPRNPTRQDTYRQDFLLLGIQPNESVLVTLDSESQGDPYLQLINSDTGELLAFDDDTGTGLNSRLRFTAQPNVNYLVRATTFEENASEQFTVSVDHGVLTPATHLFPNTTVRSFLSPTDAITPHRDARFYDGYTLAGLEPYQLVSLELSSDDFDPYLQVIDLDTGQVIAFDDDGGPGTDAALRFVAQPDAEYLIHGTSFNVEAVGEYTLSYRTPTLTGEALLIANDPLLGSSATPSILNSPIDGFGNNLGNPQLGSAGSRLADSVPLQYDNGFSTPAGQNRPNARVISNAISQQSGDIPEPRGLTNITWAYGQFLDHDISLSPEVSREIATSENRSFIIPVPSNDPVLTPGNVIALRDTEFEPGTGTSSSNPRRIPNEITAWIDGSNVYGSEAERLASLRAFSGGRLLVSEGNLLPIQPPDADLPNDNAGAPGRPLFIAGDVRANENIVLSSIHTLFVREHNRLADELSAVHPDWNDEQIFQRARQINIAQMQNITFNEYLPTLIGEELPAYQGYNPNINPQIERVFSTAAFRLGHTQLSSAIERLNPDGTSSEGGSLTLSESFFPDISLSQTLGISDILRGVASSSSQAIDNAVIEDVRSLLFGDGPNAPARDLVALNIERGRINGIADYNTVRSAYGLNRVTDFSEITSDHVRADTLRQLYGSVDNIDAFVGLLAEDPQAGSSLGESLSAILQNQFVRLRDGDRFYFENTFSEREVAAIRNTTLSDIIRRNTDTVVIQDNAFSLVNRGSVANDTINGGLGEDTIFGNGGNDTILGYTANDVLHGNGGNDQVAGGSGDDRIFGQAGGDVLLGDAGHDIVVGGDGNDILSGTSSGTYGRGEIDVLVGGSGADSFILGDENGVFYNDGYAYLIGRSDYAVITDLNLRSDQIILHGIRSRYALTETGAGVDLYYRAAGEGPELIANLAGSLPGLTLDSDVFTFV
ncbi:hypothetical protein D0962_37400 [Leptolyngbyaceae cyanobacterium CCMR0082]|uniref:Peroxidase n=1 Tax=Adonisia turfae CCMR0082 TaxID=2304604 RepID=A0A6M0SID1_9CYAN|nr:peroxidase family protein [Adonisia turfae]NEZ68339.1 hypothetical protein [Adonisia turfae CCMR0082]